MPKPAPSAAAIYCRISDDGKEGAGLGVARQEADCVEAARKLGWTVAEVYVDNDISAFSGKRRPSYHRLLADIESGDRDGLIIWHTDRLHRSAKELESFIELVEAHPVTITAVKAGDLDLATAHGRLVARMLGSLAVYESEHKSEKIRRKHRELAENGRAAGGGRHFGYDGGMTAIREDEALLVREAAGRVLAGETLSGVCRDWQGRGIRATRGGPWRPQSLRSCLTSSSIAGLRSSRQLGETFPAVWPAIVDRETWERVRAVLLAPERRHTRYRRFLLSGLVSCECGATMIHGQQATGDEIWRCPRPTRLDASGCGSCSIRSAPVEALVWEATLQEIENPGRLEHLSALLAGPESEGLADQIEALDARLASLRAQVADGGLDLADFGPMKARIQDRLDDLRRQAARPRDVLPRGLDPGRVRQDSDGWPTERKQELVKRVWSGVVVRSAKHNPRIPVQDRVDLLPRAA